MTLATTAFVDNHFKHTRCSFTECAEIYFAGTCLRQHLLSISSINCHLFVIRDHFSIKAFWTACWQTFNTYLTLVCVCQLSLT